MDRKNWLIVFILAAACGVGAQRSVMSAQQGQAKPDALATLGQPLATMQLGAREYYRYRSGIVVFEGGVVAHRWAAPASQYAYSGHVSALSSGDTGKVILIVSGNTDMGEDDLQFKEAASYLRIVLQERGLEVTDDATKADILLALNFGISDPNVEIERVDVPVTVRDPGEKYTAKLKDEDGIEREEVVVEKKPQTRVVGYKTVENKRVTFRRHLILRALDAQALRDSGREVEKWKVMSYSVGPTDDFRRILPALFAAAWQWVGADTMGKQPFQLSDSDLRVFALRSLKTGGHPGAALQQPDSSGVAAAAPAVGANEEPTDAGSLGKVCRLDKTCDQGLSCSKNVCQKAGFNGQICYPDNSCEAGLRCTQGTCRR